MKLIKSQEASSQPVSHSPGIYKRVFIDNQEIPGLTNFSSAIFKPGESVEPHAHDTKYEVFYMEKGILEFTVNGEVFILNEGDTLYIEPKESHAIINTGSSPATLLYFGINSK